MDSRSITLAEEKELEGDVTTSSQVTVPKGNTELVDTTIEKEERFAQDDKKPEADAIEDTEKAEADAPVKEQQEGEDDDTAECPSGTTMILNVIALSF